MDKKNLTHSKEALQAVHLKLCISQNNADGTLLFNSYFQSKFHATARLPISKQLATLPLMGGFRLHEVARASYSDFLEWNNVQKTGAVSATPLFLFTSGNDKLNCLK